MLIILILWFLIACNNINDNTKPLSGKLDKDSIIANIDINGNYQGPFSIYYKNGEFANGFYKDNIRDSLFLLYWPNGKLKKRVNYINGKEEGFLYLYDQYDNTKIKKCFTRHDSIIIIGYREISNKTKKIYYRYYYCSLNNEEFLGQVVCDSNNEIDYLSSSYYVTLVNDINTYNLSLSLRQKSKLSILFYKGQSKSFAVFEIKQIENQEGDTINIQSNSITKEEFENSTTFNIQINPKKTGWYFVTGEITEFNLKTNLKRTIPVFFNYYVKTD